MEVILNSDIARLVLGYLASQEQSDDKEKASLIFCKKNRYLKEEYDTYKQGWNRVDTTVGLVNLLQDFYSCQSLLDAFITKCSDKELSKQNGADNTLKGKLEKVLNLFRRLQKTCDSQSGHLERKRKLANSSSTSIVTSTPENKQPPNKRQRKADYTPFVVLNTNSGKRNQSSEKKFLSKERRKELFTSESSSDESNYDRNPKSTIKEKTPVEIDEEYEDEEEELRVQGPNVSCLKTLKSMKFNQSHSQALSETLLTRASFPDKLAENINIMLQSKEDQNNPSTSNANFTENNLTLHIDDLIDNIIGMTAADFEYDVIAKEAYNNAMQKNSEHIETIVEPVAKDEAPAISPILPLVEPVAQNDPKTYTLRDRKTTINYNEKKKKKKVINILSDEPYSGELPSCAKKFSKKRDDKSFTETSRSSVSIDSNEVVEILEEEPKVSIETQQSQQQQYTMVGPPMVVLGDQVMLNFPIPSYFQNNIEILSLPTYTSNLDSNIISIPQLPIPQNLVTVELPSLVPFSNNAEQPIRCIPTTLSAPCNDIPSNVQVVPQQPGILNELNQPKTPKLPKNLNYLNSKSKSTPRRKGSHIRILDFNTPRFHGKLHNCGKLSTIKEFSTPQGFLIGTAKTPSSAPASMKSGGMILKKIKKTVKKKETLGEEEFEVIADDSSSNSNSISNTPRVHKNRRKCRIISQASESEEVRPVESPQSVWDNMRKMSTIRNWDQHLRLQNRTDKKDKNIVPSRKKKSIDRKTIEPEIIESPDNESKIEARLIEEAIKSAKKDVQETIVTNNESIETNDNACKIINVQIEKEELVLPVKKKQIKIKIDSPRKNKAKKKTLLKSKEKPSRLEIGSKDKKHNEIIVTEKSTKTESMIEDLAEPSTSLIPLPSNRSETIKEVATTLSQLSSTILSKTTVVPSMACLLETPLKDDLNLVPDTPRFIAPLGANETPMLKFISNSNTVISVMKMCDINTPNEPLTPGFSGTPLKSGDPSPVSVNGGYSSRRTDYSSCSSYYKPDESEDINNKLDAMLNEERRTRKDSELDQMEALPMKVCVSAKKVECPGFIDKMKDELNLSPEENPNVHYTMLEPQPSPTKESSRRTRLKSKSSSRSTSSSSSSSSDTSCSSCSSSSSSSNSSPEISSPNKVIPVENEVKSFINHDIFSSDDADSDTDYKQVSEEQEFGKLVSHEGEVRFPIRNWITPRKNDYSTTTEDQSEQIKNLLQKAQEEHSSMNLCEDRIKQVAELEEKKLRVMEALRKPPPPSKFRRPLKAKPVSLSPTRPISKKENILQRNSEVKPRLKSTPQMLSGKSSRKNPTPKKTVYMPAIPVTSVKRTTKKSPTLSKTTRFTRIKSPSRTPEIAYTSIIASTPIALNAEESLPLSQLEVKSLKSKKTFHATLIEQGFNQADANLLQKQFIEDNNDDNSVADESPNKQSARTETEDEDDELQMVSFSESSSNFFTVISESKSSKSKDVVLSKIKLDSINFNIDGRKIVLSDSGLIDVFEMQPKEFKSTKESTKSTSRPKKSSNRSPSCTTSRNTKKPPKCIVKATEEAVQNPKPKVKVHHKVRPEDANYLKEKDKRAQMLNKTDEIPEKQLAKNENKSMNNKNSKEDSKQISKQAAESISKPKDIVNIDINAVLAQLHGFPST